MNTHTALALVAAAVLVLVVAFTPDDECRGMLKIADAIALAGCEPRR